MSVILESAFVDTRTDPTVVPSGNEKYLKTGVVQPMNARSFCEIPKRQWPPAEGAVSLSKTTQLLARPRQGQQLVRAEPADARERLRVVVRAAPGRERQRVLPGACGPSCHRQAVGPPSTAGGGAARCASPHGRNRPFAGGGAARCASSHGRSRPFAGDWRRHVRVGRHRPRRLLAPLSAADRSRVRPSHLCARRRRATACPISIVWIRARALQLARTYREPQWTTM